jgi:outer membrane receptor protein involved in Fe transport
MKRLWVLVLVLTALFPLHSQEAEAGGGAQNEDDFSIIMEGRGLTISGERSKKGELPVLGTEETTQQIEVIEREEIEKRQAPDIAALLEEALDLSITREGAYGNKAGINMRGFDATRVAILINGIPVNSALDSTYDLSTIDLDSVERIEVIYGGSDTKYNVSGAMGGVINIITMKKQPPGLHIRTSLSNTSYLPAEYTERDGSVGEAHAEELVDTQMGTLGIGYGTETMSFALNWFGDRAANHYLYENYYGYAMRKESNEVLDTGSSATFIWEIPGAYSKLLAQTDFYYGNKNIPLSGTAITTVNENDFTVRNNLIFDAPRFFHDNFASELILAHNWVSKDFEIITKSDTQDFTAIGRWSWYALPSLTVKTGLDYRFIHVESARTGMHIGQEAGLYLTAEYSIVKSLQLIASVKGTTDTNTIMPVPKLGLVWNITDHVRLKNNYFRTFKYPDFSQLYRDEPEFFGNVNLEAEDGFGADITAEYDRFEWLSVSATVFGEWTYNSINWVKYGDIWSPENVGTRTFVGLDTKLRSSIALRWGPFSKIGLGASFQYLLSYLLTDDLNFEDNLRVPYMPAYIAGGSVDLPWNEDKPESEGSVFVSAHYEGLRFADTTNLLPMRPYLRFNVTVHQKVTRYFDAFFVVRNILNAHYESFYEHPMPGLTLTLGVRFSYDIPEKREEQ